MSEAYVTVTQLRLCVLATVKSELIFKIGMLKHTKSFEVNFLFQLDFKLTVVYARGEINDFSDSNVELC